MTKHKLRSISVVTVFVFLVFQMTVSSFATCATCYAAPAPPEIEAESYLLADFKTGRVLMAHNTQSQQIPASLTKIMTLFITFDEISHGNLSLEDEIYISENAWRTEGSKMFVLVGTKVKLEDLIKGITVASGNDACVALAEHISGSVSSFVDRMNQQAEILGLKNTHFADPHGLSEENKVSAEDIFTLVREYSTRYPEYLKYHSLKEFTYTPPGEHTITQYNRNTLLSSYQGVYGLKTGYTSKAGYNIVVLADKDGFSTIAILLGAANGESISEGEKQRNLLASQMLDYAYDNFAYVKLSDPQTVLGQVRVWKGKGKWADAIAPNGLGATVEKENKDNVTYELIFEDDLQAPLEKGAKVGEAIFKCNGEEVGRMELVSKESVDKGNIFRVIWDSITRVFSRSVSRS